MKIEISLSLSRFLFCSIVCVLFFVLRVKTDDLSLSLYFNANENRVDERKRGERRRGAVGETIGTTPKKRTISRRI